MLCAIHSNRLRLVPHSLRLLGSNGRCRDDRRVALSVGSADQTGRYLLHLLGHFEFLLLLLNLFASVRRVCRVRGVVVHLRGQR